MEIVRILARLPFPASGPDGRAIEIFQPPLKGYKQAVNHTKRILYNLRPFSGLMLAKFIEITAWHSQVVCVESNRGFIE